MIFVIPAFFLPVIFSCEQISQRVQSLIINMLIDVIS